MKPLISLLLLCASLNAQEWKTDLDEAFRLAETRGKNVMLFFSVSDACDNCRRLENIVFQSQEFREYASDNLVIAKMDFKNIPTSTSKAEQLLIVEKYNKDGFFPWVVIIDTSRKIIGKLEPYDGQSVDEYLAKIKAANR